MTPEAPTALPDDDLLDADDFDGSPADDPVSDDDLPYVALFAGVPEDEVAAHAAAMRHVLGVEGGSEPPPAEPETKPKGKR